MQTTALVIGGGATGVGVARDLALRGVEVTLVDRGRLAAGTTGRSHGVLHSGARYAEADADDAAACLAENRILREIAPACIDETGGYFLQLDGDDPDYFERKRAACDASRAPARGRRRRRRRRTSRPRRRRPTRRGPPARRSPRLGVRRPVAGPRSGR